MKIYKVDHQSPLVRFSLITLASLAIIGALFVWLVTRTIEFNMLQRSRQLSADYISRIVSREFSTVDLTVPHTGDDYDLFAAKVRKLYLGPNVTRIKLWNRNREIVWSDDRRLVGKSFSDNDELIEALRGEIASEFSQLDKSEQAFEKKYGKLLELYVPVRSGNGEIIAVAEVYQDLGDLYDDVASQSRLIWGSTAVAFIVIYLLLFGIFRQATRRIERQNKEKMAMHDRLIEAERQQMATTIAASIGHEINNTLTSLVYLSDMVNVNKPSQELLHKLIQQLPPLVQRLKTFGKNLLSIGHPPKPSFAPIDINALLERVIGLLAESGMLKMHTILLELQAKLPEVRGDCGMLEQVVTNLAINASHAMERGGILTIRTRLSENNQRIEVEIGDTGHGIPPEHLDKIYEPFFTTKSPDKGTGLGIYIVKQIIEQHEGSIEVRSRVGAGTTVFINLPVFIV